MLTLTLTPQFPPQAPSYRLTLPVGVTFHQLHAALEVILRPGFETYYSFMLMASHHAVEANTAPDYKAAPAFRQNPQIRYLNPYPGTFVCLLELESIDDEEACTYPQISGTEDDRQINTWLKKYCDFTKDWQYQNENYFRTLYEAEKQKMEKQRIKKQRTEKQNTKRHTRRSRQSRVPDDLPVPFMHHFKNMDEKQRVWDSFCLMHEEAKSVRVTAGTSEHTQAELLEMSKKDNLLNYCRYAALPVAANWKKKQLAEAFCNNLQENTWLSMLLLPRIGLELYFRLCRLKENQKLSINLEGEAEALKVMMYLGMVDLLFTNGETDIRLELSADFKKCFQEFFKDSRNFAPGSECTMYLSPELKAGSWQKIVKGYEKLDHRVTMLLCRYGILDAEDLCEKLCAYYEYTFNRIQFERYLMLHLRLLEAAYTGRLLESGERIVSLFNVDLSYALEVRKGLVPASEQRPTERKELDEYGEWMPEQTEGLVQLLANFTEDVYLISDIAQELIYAVLGNYTWADYLETIGDLLGDLNNMEQTGFWYELSKLYLYLPVAGLGGYSRIEYAEKEQLDNPYLVLNTEWDFWEEWEDESIFGTSFEVQWQLFCQAESLIKDGNELSEKRMIKYAKKHLGPESAAGLQIYCYLVSGNPQLLKVLEMLEAQGNQEAHEMLEELKNMLQRMAEDWEPYE